jgi:hypothetical protein
MDHHTREIFIKDIFMVRVYGNQGREIFMKDSTVMTSNMDTGFIDGKMELFTKVISKMALKLKFKHITTPVKTANIGILIKILSERNQTHFF